MEVVSSRLDGMLVRSNKVAMGGLVALVPYAPVFLSPSRLMRGFLASDDSLDVDAIAIMFLRCWSFEKKDCFDRLDDQFVR